MALCIILSLNQEVLGKSILYLLSSAGIPLNRLLGWATKPNVWFYNESKAMLSVQNDE